MKFIFFVRFQLEFVLKKKKQVANNLFYFY